MKKYLILGVIIALAAFAFNGCADDKATNEENVLTVESLKDQTSFMVYQLGQSVTVGLYYMYYGAANGLAKPADSTYNGVDSSTCWWTHYLDRSWEGDLFSIEYSQSDSVRFLDEDENCQILPDSTTYTLLFRSTGGYYMSWSADSSLAFEYVMVGDFDGLTSDTVFISGSYLLDLVVEAGTETGIIDYDSEYDDVGIIISETYNDDIHPYTGAMTVSLHLEDSSNDIDAAASVTITFNDSGYHGAMTFAGITYSWDVTWEELDEFAVGGIG